MNESCPHMNESCPHMNESCPHPGGGKPGRVIFELFTDIVPRTAENFR